MQRWACAQGQHWGGRNALQHAAHAARTRPGNGVVSTQDGRIGAEVVVAIIVERKVVHGGAKVCSHYAAIRGRGHKLQAVGARVVTVVWLGRVRQDKGRGREAIWPSCESAVQEHLPLHNPNTSSPQEQ